MNAVQPILSFAEEFRTPHESTIAPQRFAEALHLQTQDLARMAGVHRATVTESPANPRLQGYLRDALRALTAAYELTSDRERAIYWYRNVPLPEFRHRTAEELMAEGRVDVVLSYLASIAPGSSG